MGQGAGKPAPLCAFELCSVRPQEVTSRDQALALATFAGRIQLLQDVIFCRLPDEHRQQAAAAEVQLCAAAALAVATETDLQARRLA